MCGIIGFVGSGFQDSVKSAIESIGYRGRDGVGTVSDDDYEFVHLLHSVVSDVLQPLQEDNLVFGANCEIYNWKELKQKHGLDSKNDAELLFGLLSMEPLSPERLLDVLAELDGVFAFFVYDNKKDHLYLARDRLGVKPLWFKNSDFFAFASEQKALGEAEELNPRKVLFYDGEVKFYDQPFLDGKSVDIDERDAVDQTKELLLSSVSKRVPERALGLLFSGGLDSTLLALILKDLNVPFKCYMTVHSADTEIAKRVAEELDLDLSIIDVDVSDVGSVLPEVISTVESADPVKVEVGTTLYFALRQAGKDGVKVIFSGLGADDIFGGYKRMRMSKDLTKDSISSLRRIYERDLYRDDTLSMLNNIELRLPFLDKKLVDFVVSLPDYIKTGEDTKPLLRSVGKALGLSFNLKRKAAQYDSGMNKAIEKLAKNNGFKSKAKYLASLTDVRPLKLGALLSGGKDSVYALHIQKRLNYDVACLITVESVNPDSFMFHTPTIDLVKYQAEAMSIPLVTQTTKGEEEAELEDLERAIRKAKHKHHIQGIITGALFSNYQRSRIENICDELNLKVFSPLWHVDQEKEMRSLIKEGFKIIMTRVAAEGLDRSWLGRVLTEKDVDRLCELRDRLGINVAGEGGEFETFVLDAPLFGKGIEVLRSAIIQDGADCVLDIKEVDYVSS